MTYRFAIPLAALLLTAASCSGGGTTENGDNGGGRACTFSNPVVAGADPWVVRHDGFYYSVESTGNAIYVYKSDKLTTLKSNGALVWSAPATGWNRSNVWAPELHLIDGRWYIYYAAGESGPPFIHQRAGVLQSAGDDPQGAYADKGMLYTGDDVASRTDPKWAIDLTVHRIAGQLYAVWSGWEQNATTDKTPQHLYIARMSDPMTVGSNRVKISSPVESWERGTELDLQEGPEFLVNGPHTFLVYSTRESWLRDYRLGLLRLTSDADPMSPASWTKSSGPVFAGTSDVYGVGHASFTTSPDGTEYWIVYHSKNSTAPGWDRSIRMQKFTWNADGSPNFGMPAQTGQQVAAPAGQCTG
ncbi:MAG TPA: glycoside hydrolase family 43 protein [Gemmatimonadaceae bacterium]|nr:glycoside hydrolase family 43 protein [Gemmatimonadaceae bacterium]